MIPAKQIAVTAHQVRIQAQAPTEVPRNTLLDRSAQFELVSVTQAAPSGSRGGTVVVPRIHTVKPVKAIVTTKERNNDKWFSVQEHKKFAASFETNGHFLAAESGPVHEGGSCCVVM